MHDNNTGTHRISSAGSIPRPDRHNAHAGLQLPGQAPALRPGDGHVWLANIDCAPERVAAFRGLLSREEQTKASRFRLSCMRDRYISARAQLRLLLGWYLRIKASQVQFRYGRYGKPRLAGACADRLHFNVAHSRGLALYALRHDAEVGVDIEYMQEDVAYREIALEFFSPEEYTELKALPAHLQLRGFYDGWVRKEAFIKATGKGLYARLSDFSVSLTPAQPARLRAIKHPVPAGRPWHLSQLDVPAPYAAAVAAEGARLHLRCWRYPEGDTAHAGNSWRMDGYSAAGSLDSWPVWRPSPE